MPLLEMVHVTAAYSNAVLVAVLPHISNFAKKLDLPIPLPITQSQVKKFRVNPIQGYVGGGVFLDHYQFAYDRGSVTVFHNLTNNPFIKDDPANTWKAFAGKDNMTTNDAIDFARNIIVKMGYTPDELHADVLPFSLHGSYNMNAGYHVPYCEIMWDNENTVSVTNAISLDFQIDMERKQLVGMELVGRIFWHSNPPVNVTPELESDFRKRVRSAPHVGMYYDTNAPTQFTHPKQLPPPP
jgi:hypothetical protein